MLLLIVSGQAHRLRFVCLERGKQMLEMERGGSKHFCEVMWREGRKERTLEYTASWTAEEETENSCRLSGSRATRRKAERAGLMPFKRSCELEERISSSKRGRGPSTNGKQRLGARPGRAMPPREPHSLRVGAARSLEGLHVEACHARCACCRTDALDRARGAAERSHTGIPSLRTKAPRATRRICTALRLPACQRHQSKGSNQNA